MTTHITLTTFVVFFAVAAFGAVVFALAHFASQGGFSPDVSDADADTEALEDAAPDRASADEATAPVQHLTQGQNLPP